MVTSYRCKSKIECLVGGCEKVEIDVIPSICIPCDNSVITLDLDLWGKEKVKAEKKKVKFKDS